MAMLSPKENYLRLARGEMPDYVPNFTMGGIWPPSGTPTKYHPALLAAPPIFPMGGGPGATEWKDMWGVPHVANAETNWQGLPKPNAFILDDITKWPDVVKRPDVAAADTFDWEKMAKDSTAHINRETTGVICMAGNGPFQALIAFMGFEEGLCALVEEPETCRELLDFMADFYMPYIEKTIEYFRPDIVYLLDDTAAQRDPFFSISVFRDIFKPVYARYGKMAKDRGIPIQFHNCGRAEDFVEDYIDIGVKYWDPAQECNNLLAVKEKYRGKIAVVGGYNFYPDEKYNNVTEDHVRATVRATLDRYAEGGGYAWLGGYLGRSDEMDIAAKINTWINDEVDTYGMNFYRK
ncbi:MAG: hypothetical protein LBC88_05385 [Spirochaetaceae bacterium]|nr:hypothetical protein [Spirochaetaceae bacterium]